MLTKSPHVDSPAYYHLNVLAWKRPEDVFIICFPSPSMSAADCTLTYIFLAAEASSRLNKNKEKNIIALQKKLCTESVTAIMSDYEFPFYRAASEVSR